MAEEHIPWSECIRHLLLLSCVINIENTQRASYLSVNSVQFFPQVAEKSVPVLLACIEDVTANYAMEPGFLLPDKYDSDVTVVFKPEVGYLQLSSDWRKIRVGATSKRCLVYGYTEIIGNFTIVFTCTKDLPVQLFSY